MALSSHRGRRRASADFGETSLPGNACLLRILVGGLR